MTDFGTIPSTVGTEAEASPRLGGLDSLRGIAAFMVVLDHYFPPYFFYGFFGVELFFVISGFVILMTLMRSRSWIEFAINRAARLYPAYWLSVIIAGAFLLITNASAIGTIAINATMLQSFLRVGDIVPAYWTLGYEFWFYCVMAVLFVANRLQMIERFALAWLVAMIAFRVAALLGGSDLGLLSDARFQLLAMPQFGNLFIAGMMLYRIHTRRATAPTYIVLVAAVAYSLWGRPGTGLSGPIYCLAIAALVGAVGAGARWFDRLNSRVLVALGLCSYSLYVLHDPIRKIAVEASGDLGGSYLFRAAVVLPIAVGAAWLAREYVERPGQRMIRTLARGRWRATSSLPQSRTV